MFHYYIKKTRFNAKHSFRDTEQPHGHSFTIVCYIGMEEHGDEAEKLVVGQLIDGFADGYRDRNLNRLEEFAGRENTLELLGDVFYEKLRIQLAERGHSLYQLDIYENPLCVYQVSDRILLPTLGMNISGENYRKVFTDQTKMLGMTGNDR